MVVAVEYFQVGDLRGPHALFDSSFSLIPCAVRCHVQRGSVPQAAAGLPLGFESVDLLKGGWSVLTAGFTIDPARVWAIS